MSLNKVYYSLASLLLLLAAFIFLCPVFVTPDLIYPNRVDSLFVRFESERVIKSAMPGQLVKQLPVLFNPGSLDLSYQQFNVRTGDNKILRGWYISADDAEANTILIVHNLNQSKIQYLNMARQMHDRGLNVCLVDLRAHGNSDGDVFTPGLKSVTDLKCIVDSLLKRSETNHIAIFGVGIGAAIAIQYASFDGRCDALIVQSPFRNFSDYVERYVKRKWGSMALAFHIVLERALEQQLEYELTELDLADIIRYVKTPTLFICGSSDVIVPPFETYAVYDSSGAKEKNLILVKKAGHENIEELGGAEYYNSIAQFIVNVIPKKTTDTRYKKLAVND